MPEVVVKRGVITLLFDLEQFRIDEAAGALTDEGLYEIGKQINDEIGSFYSGYVGWRTGWEMHSEFKED